MGMIRILCVPLALVTALFFVAVKGYGTPNAMPFADVATAMMGGTVFPMMYSAIFLLRMDGLYGKMYVLLPFCVAFLGDSFAMYGGMLFGKRKMAPAVSPHKTWAGSVAGLIGSALGLVLWGVVAQMWLGYEPNYLNLVLAGLVTNAIGQLGDLAMSLIKREAGVKDYSHIFLTHGGMWTDSIPPCLSLRGSICLCARVCFKRHRGHTMMNTISILGSTGSIGRQTLDVAEQLGLRVAALTANSNVERMEAQCRKFRPRLAVMTEEAAAKELAVRLQDTSVKVLAGTDALVDAAVIPEAETVVTAVVGMVG